MVPVYILTGFLGSGKTTVLNHLLKSPQLNKSIVIINEFGEVGLDHLFITATRETVVEMSSGCICCSIRSDLQKTLKGLKSRFHRAGKQQFDRVIIETTGLADPAPIIHTLMTDPGLANDYELRSVIATIDATCFDRACENQYEAHKQAAVADCLLLTKTDLVQNDQVQKLVPMLRLINPTAPMLITNNGSVDIDTLFSTPPFSSLSKDANVRQWLKDEAYSEHQASHHDHIHDVNRHGDINAFCITRETPIPEKAFMTWIEIVVKLMGSQMLRIKGIVSIKDLPGPVVIHGVQHIFYPLYQMEQWPDQDRRTRIIFITKGLKKESLETSLRSLDLTQESR
jgi:G3E family GTPase